MAETGRRNDSRNHRSADQRRYRKVSMCMYGDEKFCELSKPKPNGQSLWHYLIVGPRTTNLPGLFRVHLSEIASYFEWKPRDLRRVLDEILSKSMAFYDEKACVFFLPNAIKHNEPQSWNVIKGWRATFDEIPPTPLKARALAVWREHIEQAVAKGLDHGFLDAFADAFPDAFMDGIPRKTRQSRGIQEQESEQEIKQEIEQECVRTGASTAPGTQTDDAPTEDDLPPEAPPVETPTPTPPLRGRRPPLAMRGRVDVAWPGRPAVPGMLHAELRELLGGPEDDADAKLRAWYPTVAAQWDGKPIGDDAFRFWRARFREWVGTTVTVVAPVRDKQAERKAAETAFLNRRRSQA
jgi:hypothetical protein